MGGAALCRAYRGAASGRRPALPAHTDDTGLSTSLSSAQDVTRPPPAGSRFSDQHLVGRSHLLASVQHIRTMVTDCVTGHLRPARLGAGTNAWW